MIEKVIVINTLEACGYDVLDNMHGQYLQVCLQTESGMGFFYTISYEKLINEHQIVQKVIYEMNRTIKES